MTLGTWKETAAGIVAGIAAAAGLSGPQAKLVVWEDDAQPFAPQYLIRLSVLSTQRPGLKPRDIYAPHTIPNPVITNPLGSPVVSDLDQEHSTSAVVEMVVTIKIEALNNNPGNNLTSPDAIELADKIQDCIWHVGPQAALAAAGVVCKGVAMTTRRLSAPADGRILSVHAFDLMFRCERYRVDTGLQPIVQAVVFSGADDLATVNFSYDPNGVT